MTEREAIIAVQMGDKSAFRVLVEAYKEKAYHLALFYLQNEADALDVAQEAFIKVYKYIRKLDPNRPFYPYLCSVVRNLAMDHLNRQARMDCVPLEVDIPVDDERYHRAIMVWEAMEKLDDTAREILFLRYFQGLSYEEMACVLNIPKGTVMSRLFYAKRKIKKLIEGGEKEDAG